MGGETGARYKRSLRTMAAEIGYESGAFAMERMAQDIAKVRDWQSYIDAGTVPPDFSGLNLREVEKTVRRFVAEVVDRDEKWREYFYPRMRARDDTVTTTSKVASMTDDELAAIASGK